MPTAGDVARGHLIASVFCGSPILTAVSMFDGDEWINTDGSFEIVPNSRRHRGCRAHG